MLLKNANKLIEANIKAQRPVTPILLGEPGIGKSATTEFLAQKYQTKVFTLQINQIDTPTDLFGIRPKEDENGNMVQGTYPHVEIAGAIEYAKENPNKHVFLVLDEINRTRPSVTSACLTLITARKIGEDTLPDNIRLIATGNDKGNINAFDDASTTRFVLYHVEPDYETFTEHAIELNPFIQTVLSNNNSLLMAPAIDPESLFNDDDDEDEENVMFDDMIDQSAMTQKTNPRTIQQLSYTLNELGIKRTGKESEHELIGEFLYETSTEGDYPMLYEILAAHTGHTNFSLTMFEHIKKYFEDFSSNNSSIQSNIDIRPIRPEQDFINKLVDATEMEEVTDLVENMAGDKASELYVWIINQQVEKEFENHDSSDLLRETIANKALSHPDFEMTREATRLLTTCLGDSDVLDIDLIEQSLSNNKNSTFYTQFGALISSMLSLDV